MAENVRWIVQQHAMGVCWYGLTTLTSSTPRRPFGSWDLTGRACPWVRSIEWQGNICVNGKAILRSLCCRRHRRRLASTAARRIPAASTRRWRRSASHRSCSIYERAMIFRRSGHNWRGHGHSECARYFNASSREKRPMPSSTSIKSPRQRINETGRGVTDRRTRGKHAETAHWEKRNTRVRGDCGFCRRAAW